MENVYSQVKMFHFHDKLNALGRGEISGPIHVRIKPINACNHRCFYCCYRSEDLFLGELLDEKDMIPEAKMREIVSDLKDTGVRAVTFTGGGEPLLYPFFVATAKSLLASGIKVAVLTNGSRLSEERAEVLARGASWVRISIDATDGPSLAETRQVPEDEFGRIMKNIESFSRRKTGDCELGINLIVTRQNAERILDFMSRMKDAGANHVKVSECVVSTVGKENNDYHQPHFASVKAQIKRAEETLNDAGFRVIDKFHDFDDKYAKRYRTCPFIHFLNVIGADQKVYTCQDKAYTEDGILGDLKHQSLKDLWKSDDYRRKLLGVDPSGICRHHCVSHGKNLTLIDYLSTDRRHLEFV